MTASPCLETLAREAAVISSAASTLNWDQETYLPEAAAAWRAEQLSWLSGRGHELRTSENWGRAVDAAQANTDPDTDARRHASLREMRRQFERATKLPTALIERESRLVSAAKHAWAKARNENDFDAFAPHLGELLELAREKAERWGYADEPYDALLESFERGATTASVRRTFDAVEPRLREIAAAAVARSASRDARLPAGPYPAAAQQAFNREVAEVLGFDFAAGRIDTTTHPFCTALGPRDVRLTTRYDESDFTSSLFGVMHEAGHGLYEQGLEAEDFPFPAGRAVSLGIHESQSRLWENHIGRSPAFWDRWLPVAKKHFPALDGIGLADFLAAIHRAEFSFIRVEADEATYDLHILLRFGLERRLVRGELAVADVPEAWDAAFEASFGKRPPNAANGCLQDIHWSMGGLGYFPTYSLGNLHAAQLFATATADSAIRRGVESGDYAPLLGWLRERIHRPGGSVDPHDLIARACGAPPAPDAYLAHLESRYLGSAARFASH